MINGSRKAQIFFIFHNKLRIDKDFNNIISLFKHRDLLSINKNEKGQCLQETSSFIDLLKLKLNFSSGLPI
jgi:hypothetical protein